MIDHSRFVGLDEIDRSSFGFRKEKEGDDEEGQDANCIGNKRKVAEGGHQSGK